MKKLIWLIVVITIVSCKTEDKNYVILKGKLKTENIKKITILGNGFSKEITVASDGTFADTLKVTDGLHSVISNNERATLYLKNGYDLNLEFKGNKFTDGILFTGNGAIINNFLDAKRSFYRSDFANPKKYFKLDKEAFDAKVMEAKSLLKEYKSKVVSLDSIIDEMDVRNDKMFFGYLNANYEKMHENLIRFAKGKPSPKFSNYVNYNGGKTSLTDLKGKYVYIDVWATWCAPCKAEIPFLKELDDEFKGKNIEFVSISVDKQNAFKAWKQMIKEKQMKGIQLFADNNFESEFITEYAINAIPRFILLDPEGNIIDSDAVRPSNPKLKELLKELGI